MFTLYLLSICVFGVILTWQSIERSHRDVTVVVEDSLAEFNPLRASWPLSPH